MSDLLYKRFKPWDKNVEFFISQPQAPDPTATAAAQAKYNEQAAEQQAELNNVNQQTPFGSLTYQQTGTNPDGTPIFTGTTSYTPQMQALLNTGISTETGIANAANSLIGNLGQSLTQAPNLDPSAITKTAMANEQQYMSPFFTQQQSNLNSQLQNQGILPGSQAYANAQQQLQENQGNVMANSYATIEPQAFAQAVESYQLPIQTLGTLLGESQPANLNSSLVNTPQENVAAPNYEQLAEQNYQQQMANYNNTMSGLFSIPSAILGGWAKGGFSTSDKRLKKNRKRVGFLDNGLPIYIYLMDGSDTPQIGLLAQEVEKVRPEAVREFDGIKHVNYAMAVR
jgi:hypothetical protein